METLHAFRRVCDHCGHRDILYLYDETKEDWDKYVEFDKDWSMTYEVINGDPYPVTLCRQCWPSRIV